jgi:exopolysaccharide biosynthesis protein
VRRLSCAFLAACTLARIAAAEWQVVSINSEPAAVSGVEHLHLVVHETAGAANATIDLALFCSKSATLRVIENGSGSDNLAGAMAREKCVAGVNGGYFDPNFRPIGLRVIDGATVSALTRARLLTGVLCASSRGIEIVRLGEFSRRRKLNAAVECGPFLVDLGTPVAHLDDKRSARRTFAALARGGTAALGVSSELTLAQLAAALSDRSLAINFKVWRAMNLDGGSSSAFWFTKKTGSVFAVSEEKAVRDFIAVVPKQLR